MSVITDKRGLSLKNNIQLHAHPVSKTPKLAGRDFRVLTLHNSPDPEKNWYDRWIFPKDFFINIINPANYSNIQIGRLNRYFTHPDLSQAIIKSKDKIKNCVDEDSLYTIEKIDQKGDFAAELKNEKSSSTEISNEDGDLFLTLRVNSAFLKFSLSKGSYSKVADNKLLDEVAS